MMKHEDLDEALNYHIYNVLTNKDPETGHTKTCFVLTNTDSFHLMKVLEQYSPKVQLIKAFEICNCFNPEYEAKYNSFHELKTFANTQFKDPNNDLIALYIIDTIKGRCNCDMNKKDIQDDIDYLISAKKKVLIPNIWASQDMVSDYNSMHAWRNKHLKFYKE